MIRRFVWLAARARRESFPVAPLAPPRNGGPPSDGRSVGDLSQERPALAIDELEERLAPGGTAYKPPKPTAGWGC
jgi:hypothetical protein